MLAVIYSATVASLAGGDNLAGILSSITNLGGGQAPLFLENPALKLPPSQLHSVAPLAGASPVAGMTGKLDSGWIPATGAVTGLPIVTFEGVDYSMIPAANNIGQIYYSVSADDYAIAVRNSDGNVLISRLQPEEFLPVGLGDSPSFSGLDLSGPIGWSGAGAAAAKTATLTNLGGTTAGRAIFTAADVSAQKAALLIPDVLSSGGVLSYPGEIRSEGGNNGPNYSGMVIGDRTDSLVKSSLYVTAGVFRIYQAGADRLLLHASGVLEIPGNTLRIATAKTPASATAAGTTGDICWDANFVYVCTATNTWKRTAISTW